MGILSLISFSPWWTGSIEETLQKTLTAFSLAIFLSRIHNLFLEKVFISCSCVFL